jgi:hypothetical protein
MPGQKIFFVFCLICFVSSASREQQPVPPPPKPATDSPSLEATMTFIQDKLNDIGRLRYTVASRAADANHDSVFDEADELSNVVADAQGCTISYRLRESVGPVRFEVSSRDLDQGHDPATLTQVAYALQGAPGRPLQNSAGSGRSSTATFVLHLKEVKKITVRSTEQDLNETSGGKTTWTIQPPIFEVVAQTHLAGYRRQLSATEPPPATDRQSQADFFEAFFGSQAPSNGQGAILGAIVGGNPTQSAPPTPQRSQGSFSGPLPKEGGIFSVDDEELAKRLARALLHAVELCTPDKKSEPF